MSLVFWPSRSAIGPGKGFWFLGGARVGVETFVGRSSLSAEPECLSTATDSKLRLAYHI